MDNYLSPSDRKMIEQAMKNLAEAWSGAEEFVTSYEQGEISLGDYVICVTEIAIEFTPDAARS